jgi:hypothetical protein
VKLYKNLSVDMYLQPVVKESWNLLPSPTLDAAHVDLENLNYFEYSKRFLDNRIRKINTVRHALAILADGSPLDGSKVITRRYTQGLAVLKRERAVALLEYMNRFVENPLSY